MCLTEYVKHKSKNQTHVSNFLKTKYLCECQTYGPLAYNTKLSVNSSFLLQSYSINCQIKVSLFKWEQKKYCIHIET